MGIFVRGIESKLVDRMGLLRQASRVISNNIANVNVPSYTAKRLDFPSILKGEQMKLELRRTHPGHIASRPVNIRQGASLRDTGRPVELDEEVVRMTENSMEYQTMVELLRNRFDLFSKIISERVD